MAIVTWPLSSAEARGRVGGLVYNTHRGTSYVKIHALHQGEFTDPQVEARAFTAACTVDWQSLSPEDRAQWYRFAEQHTLTSWTGQPKRISAYNWFIKLNFWVMSWEAHTNWTPPTSLPDYTFIDLAANYTPLQINVTWTPQLDPITPTSLVILAAEGPYPAPRTPNIKRVARWYPTYESPGYTYLVVPATGLYYVHARWVSLLGGYSLPTHIEIVCA